MVQSDQFPAVPLGVVQKLVGTHLHLEGPLTLKSSKNTSWRHRRRD